MLFKFALGVCVSLLTLSASVAQCQSGCSDCDQESGVYQEVISGECGSSSDWDHDFYDCCRKSRFDSEVLDACCEKVYFSVFGGATSIEDFHREVVTGATTVDLEGADLVDGYILGGAVGHRVHQHFRLEAEYSYRFNRASSWFTATETNGIQTAFAAVPATGRVYSHAGMFNALYDFSQRRVRCPNFYGGGGIGVLTIDADITAAATNYVSDDSQFAYQIIGGVNYPVSQRIEVFGEYRFLGAEDLDVFDATAGTPFGDFDYNSHSLLLGLRFNR